VSELPPQRDIEAVYSAESRGVFTTLVRILGDFNLAAEALQDAFLAAMEQWTRDGVPSNPRAWLISVGRFKAIDTLLRRVRADRSAKELLRVP
jgi:RNA polymerase sigma-70 factor (ECF subfamily)